MSSKRYFLIPALLAIFCSGALGEERRSLPVSDLETWIREARPRRLDPFLVNSREVTSPISRGDAREP